MITTTLRKIKACHPCGIKPDDDGTLSGWMKLIDGLPKNIDLDAEIDFKQILEINGIEDAIWCFRSTPEHKKIWNQFAIFCAWQVKHLMRDERSITAVISAWRYGKGEISKSELKDFIDAANAAAYGDAAAYAAAGAYAAAAAGYAAYAAYAAARSAAAAGDDGASWYAAGAYAAAAYAAAGVVREKIKQAFLLVLSDPQNSESIFIDNMPGFKEEMMK